MRIVVTGATGFVGQNLVPCLLERGHSVITVSRHREKARCFPWYHRTSFIECDVAAADDSTIRVLANADAVVHLAWPGLPNYGELFHIERNYVDAYRFLKSLVVAGAGKLLIAGTCFEYGFQNGCLSEGAPAQPTTSYGVAKNFLRISMESLSGVYPFQLQWARLFYMYGKGQSESSLIGQLDAAISRGDSSFKMSRGDQLRDFLPIEEVVKHLAVIVECPSSSGVLNVCSGTPVSVRGLVESYLAARQVVLDLNLGFYPYSPHEPMAFWGDNARLRGLEQV